MVRQKSMGLGLLLLALTLWLLPQTVGAQDNVRQKLAQESTLEEVLRRGVLRVGFSTFVPWAMQDKTGAFIGFEIEVAERLAKDLGVQVEFVPTKWSGIIPALLTGKFDVIIGGMTITPERNIKVNFTRPYYHSGMALVAHKELAAGFGSLEDFNKAGVVIVARLGTTAAQAAKKHLPQAEVRLFDEEAQALQELLNGRAHAFVSMAPLPATQALKHSDKLFMPLEGTFTKEPNGFAVRKGDPDTLNFLDNWITGVELEGWIQERYHYWFETLDWEDRLE